MKKFPVTIVDNFYENPELIREWALSLEYSRDPSGRWPGERTVPLHNINEKFFHTFARKVFGLFVDFESEKVKYSIETEFQRITNYSDDPNSAFNHGWIHQDNDVVFAGVIYLNPNPTGHGGTNIYRPYEETGRYLQDLKFKLYSGEDVDESEYTKQILANNTKFEKTVAIKNVFNRMILFEGGVDHGVPSFYSKSDEPRLTQVFFVHQADCKYPIVRSKVL